MDVVWNVRCKGCSIGSLLIDEPRHLQAYLELLYIYLFIFLRALRGSLKYSAILHTKTSNNIYGKREFGFSTQPNVCGGFSGKTGYILSLSKKHTQIIFYSVFLRDFMLTLVTIVFPVTVHFI